MPDYDAIVIGSGTGGMTAAAALARAGKHVAIFEQHYLIGGYSQSFDLKGFQFSPGVHYVGDLGPGGELRRIYEGLGLADDLGFFELNPDGFEHIVIGNERFDMPKGMERFRDRLTQQFPREAKGIEQYLDTIDRMAAELRPTMPHGLLGKLAMIARMPMTLRYGLLPFSRFLDNFTHDPLLRAILSIQAGDHGMAPSRVPAIVHAGVQHYYMDGGCYPRGGAHAIPQAMLEQVRAHGGELHLRTKVERVLIQGRRAVGVELSDGQHVCADIIVSNVDPGLLWGRMIDRQYLSPWQRWRIQHQQFSVSTASLFFATNMDLAAAGLDSGNIWYSRTTNIDAAYELGERREFADVGPLPGLFLSITTLKDPTLRSDGLHTGEAIFFAPWDAFSRWQASKPGRRPPEYEDKKRYIRELVLDTLDRLVPGLSDHIVFSAVGTPLTNTRYVNATRGAVYGPELSLLNIGPFRWPIKTEIPGLFQCGSSTLAPGIHGVTRSGLAAAAAALSCPSDALLDARGQSLQVWPADDASAWPAELVTHAAARPAARTA